MTLTDSTALAVHDGLAKIIAELNEKFYERAVVIDVLMATLLAKQHGFLYGPPGTAKSELLEELCRHIDGAEYWRQLFDRQMGKEDIFGPIDIAHYDKTGEWRRNIEHTLATCHVALADEVGKAGAGTMNMLLTAMNERLAKTNGGMHKINLLSLFGAANELFEPGLEAIFDRFLPRLYVEPIKDPANFEAFLDTAVTATSPTGFTVISLADLEHVIDKVVPTISLPKYVKTSLHTLRVELWDNQIFPSDRRFKQFVRLLQASAFLAGRDQVEDDDIAIGQHVFWNAPEQRDVVTRKVLSLTSPVTKKALEITDMVAEISQELANRRGQSDKSLSDYGAEANFKLKDISKQAQEVRTSAVAEQRNVGVIDDAIAKVNALRKQVVQECLGLPVDVSAMDG